MYTTTTTTTIISIYFTIFYNLQDCESREDALKTEVSLLEEEYEGSQYALRQCLNAAMRADREVAGGSTTALLMVAAAARVLWYQVYGLDGPVFPLDRWVYSILPFAFRIGQAAGVFRDPILPLLVFQLSVRRCSLGDRSPAMWFTFVLSCCLAYSIEPLASPGGGCWPRCGPLSPLSVGCSWKPSSTEAATTVSARRSAPRSGLLWRGWTPSRTSRRPLQRPSPQHPGRPWRRTDPRRRVRRPQSCWWQPGRPR